MKILVVGGGGREHAIAWKLAQSPRVKRLWAAPGNAGIADIAECVDIAPTDIQGLLQFAEQNRVDITVVGPESPLIAGIVDAFEAKGLAIFGPSKDPAQLEGSKAFAKETMRRYNVPTAAAQAFSSSGPACEYVRKAYGQGANSLVIKADGEAAGKGVFITHSVDEALEAVCGLLDEGLLGPAGRTIVVEERLYGEEASLLALTDGKSALLMPAVQDNKRALDGDRGLNTGGMGCTAPVPFITPERQKEALDTIIYPTIQATRDRGIPFRGVLYAGVMMTEAGMKTLEFNVRFGDPETQVLMPLMDTDLLDVIEGVVQCRLDQVQVTWRQQAAVTVVVASGGYPGKYQRGLPISGLREASAVPGVVVFHAGTTRSDGQIVTSGGRVLCVTALGDSMQQARASAYEAIRCIQFDCMHFRTDIGLKWC